MTVNDCLSIDLGTYRIRAAYRETAPIPIGPRVSQLNATEHSNAESTQEKCRLVEFDRHELFMPSVVSMDKNGILHFGRDAGISSSSPSSRCTIAQIVENVNAPFPILVKSFADSSSACFIAKDLLVEFFKHIKQVSEQRAGRAFKLAALAFPTRIFRSVATVATVQETLKLAEFEDAEICEDSTALLSSCTKKIPSVAECSLIVDWGYSALRLDLVRANSKGIEETSSDCPVELVENGHWEDPLLGGEKAIFQVGKYVLSKCASTKDEQPAFTPANRILIEDLLVRLQKNASIRVSPKGGSGFVVARELLVEDILGSYLKQVVDSIEKMICARLGDANVGSVYMSGPLCKLLNLGDKLVGQNVCESIIYSDTNDEKVLGAFDYVSRKLRALSASDKEHAVLDNLSIEVQRADLILTVCEKNLANGKCKVWYGKGIPEGIRTGAKRDISLDQQMVLVCDCTKVLGDGGLGFVLGTRGIAYRSNPTWNPLKTQKGFIPWEVIKADGVYYIKNTEGNRELVIHEIGKQGGHHIDVNCSLSQDQKIAHGVVGVIKEIAKSIQSKLLFTNQQA